MDIANQVFPIAMLLSFLLGALSFLSPCVLPIVPPYLAYMSGVRMDEIEHPKAKKKLIISSIYFVLGLSTVFLIMALVINRLANVFIAYQGWINVISGAIIITFGLHFLGIVNFKFLNRDIRAEANPGTSALGAYFLGLAFALGWSPCLGPALSAILAMIAQESTLGRGLILMSVYAMGLGLPFVLAAILMEHFMRAGSGLRKHMSTLKRVMGILLIIIGVMMITGNFTEISNWLLDSFPLLGRIG